MPSVRLRHECHSENIKSFFKGGCFRGKGCEMKEGFFKGDASEGRNAR
jgi:hypothetical protein